MSSVRAKAYLLCASVPPLDHEAPPLRARRSPAQAYALVIGGFLFLAGATGFAYNASFDTGAATLTDRDAVFGILDVNGWHNVVHLVTGLAGLAVAGKYGPARAYAGALGVLYLLVAFLGFAVGDGETLLDLLPVNTEDNVLHLLIGAGGLAAWGLTSPEPGPSTV